MAESEFRDAMRKLHDAARAGAEECARLQQALRDLAKES